MPLNGEKMRHFPFIETPVEYLPTVSKKHENYIYVKRDDTFHCAGGGNKARKLQYILYKAQQEGCNAVVTAGDINSNHNRATALMCAKLHVKVKLIIHNDHPEKEEYSINSFLSRLCGAELIYCSKSDVAETMDKAMFDFKKKKYSPYYIWGGGHCLEGSFAYYDAIKNLKKQITFIPDYVFLASGTGTTHAGIYVGMKHFFPTSKVVGISISRDTQRGTDEIYKSIVELERYLKFQETDKESIIFIDDFVGNGYELIYDDEILCIKQIMHDEGLILDPTYTGKAFYGMLNLCSSSPPVPSSDILTIAKTRKTFTCPLPVSKNILFWHTGGIFNLCSNKEYF
jgi:1-aminocyclopropane-1-carboxylate deaminase/D-cysteine desulfhydrase-like pyridoxal-dependent ACC family enzyme